MQNKLLLFTFLGFGLMSAATPDFKMVNQDSIIVKPIKETRQAKRKRMRAQQSKRNLENKTQGLIVKSIREQNIDELKHNLAIYQKYGNTELTIKYLQALIAKLVDFIEIRDLRLQLADLYFKHERYDKAGSVYLEYFEAYPGYMSAEYALFQAILCKYKETKSCDRDNSNTLEVLNLGKQYIQNKSYLKYQAQILEMMSVCTEQVFASEIQVFEHYFRSGYLKAAQRRLDYMREKILPKQPEVKSKIDELQALMERANRGENPWKLLKAYQRELAKKELAKNEKIKHDV